MERKERRLDGECGDEAEEDPVAAARAGLHEVKGALRKAERNDRRQHQQRARHRVDDELHRRADPAGAAPDSHQDVERDQHRLEEDVEEEQVLGGEDADDRADEEEQQAEVGARPLAAHPEAVADRRCADDDGEADEPERESVEADVVRRREVGEPRGAVLELDAGRGEVELLEGADPEADLCERDEERERAGGAAGERREPDCKGAGEREQDEGGRHSQRTVTKTRTRTATDRAIASA